MPIPGKKQKAKGHTLVRAEHGSALADLAKSSASSASGGGGGGLAAALPPSSITNEKIVSVDGTKVVNNSITNEKIVSVDGTKVVNNSITNEKIVSVDGGKISNSSITNNKIVSVDGSKISNSSITNDKIVSVDGSKVTNNSITASQIAAGAVGASELTASGVTAGSYAHADITVDEDGRIILAADGGLRDTTITAINYQIINKPVSWGSDAPSTRFSYTRWGDMVTVNFLIHAGQGTCPLEELHNHGIYYAMPEDIKFAKQDSDHVVRSGVGIKTGDPATVGMINGYCGIHDHFGTTRVAVEVWMDTATIASGASSAIWELAGQITYPCL